MTINEFLNIEIITTEKYTLTVLQLLMTILVFVVARLIIWLTRRVLNRIFERNGVDIGRRHAILQTIMYVIYVVAILLALESMGLKLSVLLAGSAALLVGIGLGLQSTFKDLVAGVILLFEGTVEVGDIIEVEDMVAIVKKINLRTSKVLTRDGISLTIPNSFFIENKVANWSQTKKPARFQVSVGVAYGSDTELVTKLLIEASASHPNVLKKPAPHVEFQDFQDSSLFFVLHFFSREYFRSEIVKSDIRYKIAKLFDENNVIIPFPQQDVWLRNK